MLDLTKQINMAKKEKKELFYNNSGSKLAYRLGVKHIGSSDFLGFSEKLPNGTLRIKKTLYLVDFENSSISKIDKGSIINPVKLYTGEL